MGSVPMLRGAYRTRFAPGVVLAGRYRVERPLKSGGMGLLLLGQHLELERPVAIKVLLDTQANDEESVARFFREAKAAARLNSEHVVKVYDVGSLEDGMPYIVMELLEGEDLARMLRNRGPLPIPEVIEYMLQACIGLAEAHRNGIIHRDIKPGNIFVSRRKDGRPLVKLVDFGISKLAPTASHELEPELTTTSQVMGSPHYMSPEQLKSTREVDARADIWSLGAVLVRLISGSYAFEGDSDAELCANVLMGDPLPLRRVLPSAPKALEALVARCLTRDPAQRIQNVTDFARELAPFLGVRGEQLAAEVAGTLTEADRVGADASSSYAAIPAENTGTRIDGGRSKAVFFLLGVVALLAIVAVAGLVRSVLSESDPSPSGALGTVVPSAATASPPATASVPVVEPIPIVVTPPVPPSTKVVAPPPNPPPTVAPPRPRPRPQGSTSATPNDFGGRK